MGHMKIFNKKQSYMNPPKSVCW